MHEICINMIFMKLICIPNASIYTLFEILTCIVFIAYNMQLYANICIKYARNMHYMQKICIKYAQA